MAELAALAETDGLAVVASFSQALDRPMPRTLIGKGKVEEIAEYVEAEKVDIVLFSDTLSPSQAKNLEKAFKCKVWDRTRLILDIFAMRAQTAHAKAQVALAYYEHMLSQLTGMWGHLSRQGGRGTGLQGTGEKELETDKRLIREKLRLLKAKVAKMSKQASVAGSQRGKEVRIALVGYTNAGKSTLMGLLSGSDARIEDKLFATLSTSVRKTVLYDLPFLLSDTVGFIRDLPRTLLDSFHSTLEEVRSADLLLHVVDVSNPAYPTHIEEVNKSLGLIGAAHIRTVLVLNKIDRTYLSAAQWETSKEVKYRQAAIAISALKEQDIDRLKEKLFYHLAPCYARKKLHELRSSRSGETAT